MMIPRDPSHPYDARRISIIPHSWPQILPARCFISEQGNSSHSGSQLERVCRFGYLFPDARRTVMCITSLAESYRNDRLYFPSLDMRRYSCALLKRIQVNLASQANRRSEPPPAWFQSRAGERSWWGNLSRQLIARIENG